MTFVMVGSAFDPMTSLLLHGEGSDGSTDIIDSSKYAHVPLNVNNAEIDTDQAKIGTGSIFIPGPSGRIRYTITTELTLGSGDFCIEWWTYLNDPGSAAVSISAVASTNPALIVAISGGVARTTMSSDGINRDIASNVSIGSVSPETWTHIALSRDGSTFRGFVDGVVGATFTSALAIHDTGGNVLRIGEVVTNLGTSYYSQGRYDELRITKGKPRYTAAFTPPNRKLR